MNKCVILDTVQSPALSEHVAQNMTWIFFRGADVNKNANSDDIEMKANLVNNKGDPNYEEETGPWNLHSLFVYEIHSATVFKDFKP